MVKTQPGSRIISGLLVLVMLFGMLPAGMVKPADASSGGNPFPPNLTMINPDYGGLSQHSAYVSPNGGVDTAWFHIFNVDMAGTESVGMCMDHSKHMGTGVAGQTWNFTALSTLPAESLRVLDFYYYGFFEHQRFHAETGIPCQQLSPGVMTCDKCKDGEYGPEWTHVWSEWACNTWNAVVQAVVWLSVKGILTAPLSDPAQLDKIVKERNAVLKAVGGNEAMPDSQTNILAMRDLLAITDESDPGYIPHYQYAEYAPSFSNNYQRILVAWPTTTTNEAYEYVYVQLQKYTEDTDKPLAGCTFTIYDDPTMLHAVGTLTTTDTEWSVSEKIQWRETYSNPYTFYLKETSAPEGYAPSGQDFTVSVNKDTNKTPETAAKVNNGEKILNGTKIVEQEPEGIVVKVDRRNGECIGPATFHFSGTSDDGLGYDGDFTTDLSGVLDLQWWDPTGAQGTYIKPGVYIVTEKVPPPGYLPDDSAQRLTLTYDPATQLAESSGPLIFADKKKPSLKVKKVDPDGNPLAGAVFEVKKDGLVVTTLTTDGSGEAVYDGDDHLGIEPGTYFVTETKAPEGYQIPRINWVEIYVGANDDIEEHTVTMENTTWPEIRIRKEEQGTGKGLAGATFEIWIDDQLLDTRTTDTSGEIHITHAEYGQFFDPDKGPDHSIRVRETKAPKGYLLNTEWQFATVKDGQDLVTFTFLDSPGTKIEVYKNSDKEGHPLAGASFRVEIDGKDFGVRTTDSTGKLEIPAEEVLAFMEQNSGEGKDSWTVKVTEVSPPPDYMLPPEEERSQTAEFQKGQEKLVFTFRDSSYPEIHIKKKASNGQPLEGAEFEVEIDGRGSLSASTNAQGELIIDYAHYGEFLDENMDSLHFVRVKETKAPDGYLIEDPEWRLYEMLPGQEVLEIEFTDPKYPKLIILKQAAKTQEPLAGAVFEVTIDGESLGSAQTNQRGELVFENDELGDWLAASQNPEKDSWNVTVTEIAPPPGYLLPDEPTQTGVLHKGQEEMTFVFVDDRYPEFHIKKVAADGQPLAGAVFDVYIDGHHVETLPTNDDGEIIIDYDTYAEFLNWEDGPTHHVDIQETRPPDGYLIDDPSVRHYDIEAGQELLEVVYTDSKYPRLTIYKQDSKDRQPLAGATFQVTIDGEVIGTGVTNEQGELVFAENELGEWLLGHSGEGRQSWTVSVTEIDPPPGYLLPDPSMRTQTGVLHQGEEEMFFVFTDDRYPEIHIEKKARDGQPLEGALFDVKIDGHDMETYGTDAEGNLDITWEEYGRFFDENQGPAHSVDVREKRAPDGYLIDDYEWHHYEIMPGQELVELEFVDTKYPRLRIYKQSANGKEPLAGAVFEVFIDDQSLGTGTTDENGELIYDYDALGDWLAGHYEDGRKSWTITVTEIEPPSGYLLPENPTQSAELQQGMEELSFTFTDDKYPKLRIIKKSTDGDLLEGAIFEVQIDGYSFTTDGTGPDGEILIDYETYAEFLNTSQGPNHQVDIREIQPPNGYLIDDYDWHHYEIEPGQELLEVEFTDTIYPKIKIYKQASDTSEPLANAVFELRIDGEVIGTYRTDEFGELIISDDSVGRFLDSHRDGRKSWTVTVTEIEPPPGFLLPENPTQSATLVQGDKEITFTFTDDRYPDIRLKKKSQSDEPLAGAVFEVSIDGMTFTTDATGPDGEILIDWATYGRFLDETQGPRHGVDIREITPPDGYLLDDPSWHHYEIEPGQALLEVEFTDTIYPKITVVKLAAKDGQPLADAVFEVKIDDTVIGTWTTNDNGELLIDEAAIGRYLEEHSDGRQTWTVTVTEISPPPGYMLPDPEDRVQTAELHQGDEQLTFTFKDFKYPKLRIKKVSEDGTPLPGAVFDVEIDGHRFTTDGTDENGEIIIEYETYAEWLDTSQSTRHHVDVKEVYPPDGYLIDDPEWRHYEMVPGQELLEVEYTDSKYPHLEVYKQDANTGELLPGATFEVQIDGEVLGTWTTDENGKLQIDEETWGRWLDGHADDGRDSWTVTVTEVAPPPGYLLPDPENRSQTAELHQGAEGLSLVFEDYKYPKIRIVKKSTDDQPLAGAVFEVEIDGHRFTTNETDENGEIIIDWETYKQFLDETQGTRHHVNVREITPPAGYLIDDMDWHTYEMEPGQELLEVVFTDTKYPEIVIAKKDKETGEYLPNATFDVRIEGTSFAEQVTTGEDGTYHITWEEFGRFLDDIDKTGQSWTVTVTEVKAPDNYNRDKQGSGDYTQTQQLKFGQDVTEFVFEDTSYRDLIVYKRDSDTNWPLAGATFHLHCVALEDGDPGTVEERDVTTGEDGIARFDNLPNGTYEIEETQPPFGYEQGGVWSDTGEGGKRTLVVTSDSAPEMELDYVNEPESGLTLFKRDAMTNEPVAGAVFQFTPLAPLTDAPFQGTTDANGMIVFEDLPNGTYLVQELEVPPPYILNDEPFAMEISDQHDAYPVTILNYAESILYILKLDAETREPLEGAYFEVRTASGELVANVGPTGPTGMASLSGLKPGSYVVKETKSPTGHQIDPTPQSFEIKEGESGKVITLTFDNAPESTLWLQKIDEESGEGLEGAVFKITKANGEVVRENVVSDRGGYLRVDGLEPGTYIVIETKAPDGYILDSTPRNVELKEGQNEIILITNRKLASAAVRKVDETTGLPLSGAEFQLYDSEGHAVGEPKTSGPDGYVRWEDLQEGHYTVKETKAPDGFAATQGERDIDVKSYGITEIEWPNSMKSSLTIVKRDGDTLRPLANAEFAIYTIDGQLVGTVTTDGNGTVSSPALEAGWYKVVETRAPVGYQMSTAEQLVEVKNGEALIVEFIDYPERNITIRKEDALSGQALAGAEFELQKADGTVVQSSIVTDASGTAVTQGVEPGQYYLVEKRAPDGYVLSGERIPVTVTEDQNVEIKVTNAPQTAVQVFKYDSASGNPIGGVTFDVLDSSQKVIGTIVTDLTGMAYTQQLSPGKYYLRETKAAAGYVLDSTLHEFTVTEDGSARIDIENVPECALTVQKVGAQTGIEGELRTPLGGAVFELRSDTGHGEETLIGTYTTDEYGRFTTEPLAPGYYMLKEVKAPAGYAILEDEVRVYVKAGEANEIVIEDIALGSLLARKIDSRTGEPVAGAVIKLETADHDLVGTMETDANGEALFTGLHAGHYIVTETQAPEGYSLSDPNSYTITIENGKVSYVDFVNSANGSLVVYLQDFYTDEYLPGGHFTVTRESDQIVVFDGSTDTTGTFEVGNLLPGWYTVTQTFPPDGWTMKDITQKVEILPGQQQSLWFKDETAGLVIEKVDSTRPELMLEGARFQVTRNEDNIVIGEFVTDKDGLAMVSGLQPGMYTVEELVAPTGYMLNQEPQLVHVKGGTTAHVTFMDDPYTSITVHVKDKTTGQPVPGAVIEVWKQNGNLVNSYVTDSAGCVMTDKLPAGYYVIKIVYVPDGYAADGDTEVTVEVKDNDEVTYTFEVVPNGVLKVLSTNSSGSAIPGMRFTLETMDGRRLGTYTTRANGTYTFGSLEPGWYTVTEVKAPDGYTEADPAEQKVEIVSGRTATAEFRHGQVYGLQIRTTTLQTGAPVAGATYKITGLNGENIGNYTTNDAGIVMAPLTPGWYVVTPVSAPDGCSFVDPSPVNVEVYADKLAIVDFVVTEQSSLRVKVFDGATGAPLYGVRLQLRSKDTGACIKEYYTDNNGYVYLDKSIVAGGYVLEMISAPDGYIIDPIPKSIDVLVAETTDVNWAIYHDAGQIQVEVRSSDYNPTLDVPAGTLLQGAVFEITNADTYQVVGQMISDSQGIAASAGLPVGRYFVKMITAPAYYGVNASFNPECRIFANGEIIRQSVTVKPVTLGTEVKIDTADRINAGANFSVKLTKVDSTTDERLDNFYLHIKVPTDAVRINAVEPGIWNTSVWYSIEYKTNINDYRPFQANLNSTAHYSFDFSSQALGLQGDEFVTDIRFVFGTVPAGFHQTEVTEYQLYVLATVAGGYKILNRVDVGGQLNQTMVSTNGNVNIGGETGMLPAGGMNDAAIAGTGGSAALAGNSGQWTSSADVHTTVVNGTPPTQAQLPSRLPKTGY